MIMIWNQIINRLPIFLKKHVYPTGIDMGSSFIKMAQLVHDGKNLRVASAVSKEIPASIQVGSSEWQKWAVEAIKEMISKGNFTGKEVIISMPSDEVFIDQIKVEQSQNGDFEQAVLAKVRTKLPFNPEGAMVKYVVVGPQQKNEHGSEVLVMAAERVKVDRHLAIFERANLETKSIGVWPLAMTRSYTKFFGRRKADLDTVVMLIDIGVNHSNVVICKHSDLLFARMVPIGFNHFVEEEMQRRLMSELDACCRHYESLSNGSHIERLLFLSS